MGECKIILPLGGTNNEKEFIEIHSDFIEEIVLEYGNCRALSVISFYRDIVTGKVTDTDCVEYTFFVDKKRTKHAAIHQIAEKYAKLCKVSNVYVVTSNGVAGYIPA